MKKKGFTLVELLAVIVILGILISISTVAIVSISKKQDEKNRINVISAILTGAKEYVAENPTILNQLSSSTDAKIAVNDLKSGNFVDFDEKKYPSFKDLDVNIKLCTDDASGKLKYILSVDGKTYNDCGCELQASGSDSTSENICEG